MLGASKSIWGFDPRSIAGCTLWLDGADNATMDSTSAVTVWNDKSGQSNTMTGTGTWSGGTMVFNGTTNAFSNTAYVFPFGAYSMFAVYSNTTAPAAAAYMNAVYGSNGFPMLGVYDVNKYVTARSVVANTGALVSSVPPGWGVQITSTGTDIGYAIATDSSGNVFVTGQYGAALILCEASGSAASLQWTGNTDVFIAKYSSAGSVLWAAQIASTVADVGRGVATDTSGNVFVTGSYGAALTLYNSSGVSNAALPFSAGTDVFVAKYSSTGSVLWAAQIGGTGADVGRGISTDTSGNVFVTGYYGAALTLYNSSGVSNAALPFTGGSDCFIAKYSSAGAVLWAAQITGTTTSADAGYGIATDSSGNVFVTGSYGAALTLYNSSGVSNASLPFAGSLDCFIAKYSSAGSVLWAAQIGGTGGDIGNGIATDTSGNVFVTGQYGAALTLYNSSGVSNAALPFTGGNDCFIAKYSSAGAVLWAAQIAGPTTSGEGGNAIATDPSGNVFVTGNFGNALTLYNANGTVGGTVNGSGSGCFVVKYSSAGTVVWGTKIYGGSSTVAVGNGIATDLSGNSFVTGYYSGQALFFNNAAGPYSGGSATTPNGTDGFIGKYSPDGYTISNSSNFASSNILVSATYSPASGSFLSFVNGFPQSNRSGTTLATTGIYVGGPSNYFSGSISEVLIFGATLTDTQRQSVEGYLSRKWGIGSSLISTHPFYTIPPLSRAFSPTDVAGCSLWLDGADNSSMNSTTTVTVWNDKSGVNNTMTGTATWTGSNMSFNGSTQAFSNLTYVFPTSNYSMFAVYSNTTAPGASAYMNAVYGSNGFPMLGIFGSSKFVSARSVVANTGAVGPTVGWAARIAGSSNDFGMGVATDPSGNVLVTGYTLGAVTVYNVDGTSGATLGNAGSYDCFIAKYSSAGAVLWAAQVASTGADQGNSICTDTSGNVYVTGSYSAALTIYGSVSGSVSLPFTGGTDVFIAKYSSTGSVLWAAQITGTGASTDQGNGIATDTSGNVFVTGSYAAALTLYNSSGVSNAALPFTGSTDCFITKYSSAGAVLWAAQITGTTTSSDQGNAIATDASGNVFVTGYYGAALTLYNSSGVSNAALPYTGGDDCFIAKYSSTGSVLWAAQIAGTTTSADGGKGIATDPSGNVFVTGYYQATLTLFNTGGTTGATLSNIGNIDCFVAKYSSAGAVLWAARIASTNAEFPNAIATDPSGNVLVTGYTLGAVTVYNVDGTSGAVVGSLGGNECFIAKYSSAGTVLWAAEIGSTGSDQGNGIATDTSGNVFVTGNYGAALTLYNTNGTTGATLGFSALTDVFIAKYSSDGYITNKPIPASSNVLVSATKTSTTFSPFINGYTCAALTGGTLLTTGIYVGGPSNYFSGSISEVIIYGANLSSAQRQQVEGYLIQKWQLGTQTLSNHPYKIMPPANSQPPLLADVTYGNWTRDWNPYVQSLVAKNNPTNTTVIPTLSYGTNLLAPSLSLQKYNGGVLAPNGNIYCAPNATTSILVINPTTNNVGYITPSLSPVLGSMRCWGGVLAPNGIIYFVPYSSSNVVAFNTLSYSTYLVGGGMTPDLSTQLYHGGALAPNGLIYCAPYTASNILIITPSNGGVTYGLGGTALSPTLVTQPYSGAVLAPNGLVYCIPNGASNILIIDGTGSGTAATYGSNSLTPALSTQKYDGGVLAPNGNIYCVPNGASNILIINPTTNTVSYGTGGPALSPALSTQLYSGGVLAPNGNIYCAPDSNTSNILIINPTTNTVSYGTGGPALSPALSTQPYRGAVLASNGNIYCPPNGASNILIISNTYTQLQSSNYALSAYTNKF